MSLFASVQNTNIKTTDADVLPTGTVATGVYPAVVKMAYLDASKSGAISVNFEFELTLPGNTTRTYKETVFISNKEKSFTYKDKKTGEDKPMPGFQMVDTICKVATGKGLAEMGAEPKDIKIYSFEQKEEVVAKREVLMGLLKAELELGIQESMVNKQVKSGDVYVNSAETRDVNEIRKPFTKDGLTSTEKEAGATEAKFKAEWLKKFGGKKQDKTVKADVQAGSAAAAAPAASALFG